MKQELDLPRAERWGAQMLRDAEAGCIPAFEKRDWNGAALYQEILRLRREVANAYERLEARLPRKPGE